MSVTSNSLLSVSIKSEDSFKSVVKADPMKIGDVFPNIVLTTENGSPISLNPQNNRPKLVVFYRGAFCNFCEGEFHPNNFVLSRFFANHL